MEKKPIGKKILDKVFGPLKNVNLFGKFIGGEIADIVEERKKTRGIVREARSAESMGDYSSAGQLYLEAGEPRLASNAYERSAYIHEVRGNYDDALKDYELAGAAYPRLAKKYDSKINFVNEKIRLENTRAPEGVLVGLARAAVVLSFFVGSLFYFSSITGAVIATQQVIRSYVFGSIFFILGLIFVYIFYFRKKY